MDESKKCVFLADVSMLRICTSVAFAYNQKLVCLPTQASLRRGKNRTKRAKQSDAFVQLECDKAAFSNFSTQLRIPNPV
jgi:hypothetical protein